MENGWLITGKYESLKRSMKSSTEVEKEGDSKDLAIIFLSLSLIWQSWAVVVVQLAEQLIPIPEVCGSNTDIGKFYKEHFLLATVLCWKSKIKREERLGWPFIKKDLAITAQTFCFTSSLILVCALLLLNWLMKKSFSWMMGIKPDWKLSLIFQRAILPTIKVYFCGR